MNTFNVCNEHRITITAESVDQNPNVPEWGEDGHHWRVTLRFGRCRFTGFFSMGRALTDPPKSHDVLDCLINDANGLESSFEEWCNDYGYDTDSRRAERVYQTTLKQTEKLKKFLGEDLYQKLLDAERL